MNSNHQGWFTEQTLLFRKAETNQQGTFIEQTLLVRFKEQGYHPVPRPRDPQTAGKPALRLVGPYQFYLAVSRPQDPQTAGQASLLNCGIVEIQPDIVRPHSCYPRLSAFAASQFQFGLVDSLQSQNTRKLLHPRHFGGFFKHAMINEIFQAIILGIVQGLTEFLPVSSSGHLELGKVILGWEGDGGQSMLMTVALHAATALSTIVIFWKDIVELIKGVLKFKWNVETKFVAMIVVSMIPAALVGIFLEEQLEALFNQNLLLVGAMLLITGVLLLLADRAKNTEKSVTFPTALMIGISQAIAILPGISRSGATISTSVLLGIDRTRAARFSFLMVVPLIFGKMAKDLLGGEFAAENAAIWPLVAGFAAAFFTGLLACKWMIALVRACKLWTFSIYCFIVGAIAIGYTLIAG